MKDPDYGCYHDFREYDDIGLEWNELDDDFNTSHLIPTPSTPSLQSAIVPVSDELVLCEYIENLYETLYEDMNPELWYGKWGGKKVVRNWRYRTAKFWTAGIKSLIR
jgi:hypothetical protein